MWQELSVVANTQIVAGVDENRRAQSAGRCGAAAARVAARGPRNAHRWTRAATGIDLLNSTADRIGDTQEERATRAQESGDQGQNSRACWHSVGEMTP